LVVLYFLDYQIELFYLVGSFYLKMQIARPLGLTQPTMSTFLNWTFSTVTRIPI